MGALLQSGHTVTFTRRSSKQRNTELDQTSTSLFAERFLFWHVTRTMAVQHGDLFSTVPCGLICTVVWQVNAHCLVPAAFNNTC